MVDASYYHNGLFSRILKMQVLYAMLLCRRLAAALFSCVACPQKEVNSFHAATDGELVLALVFGLFHGPSICLFDLLSAAFGKKQLV